MADLRVLFSHMLVAFNAFFACMQFVFSVCALRFPGVCTRLSVYFTLPASTTLSMLHTKTNLRASGTGAHNMAV